MPKVVFKLKVKCELGWNKEGSRTIDVPNGQDGERVRNDAVRQVRTELADLHDSKCEGGVGCVLNFEEVP